MLWSDAPPEPRTRRENYPTLLFSWWTTAFAVAIILFRLGGRKVRTNVLFREDHIMALSLIPLLARMALVHVILIYGTNNVDPTRLTDTQIHHRSIGSRLVLASRISYAMFIWISKFTVSEFLKRIFYNTWRRSYEVTLHFIRIFLLVTFIAVVIATISECQPFDHYWQVSPDPGPHCRQGFAQLITMGVADMITDILLVAFPIPLIWRSSLPLGRKLTLMLLFSFSLILIGITGSRVPEVIKHRGRQQYRTVWASIEILISAFVSNAVVLGSFIRDTGVKRNKYRPTSMTDSITRVPTRRPTVMNMPSDSDEDLFRAIGCRMPAELMEELEEDNAPIAKPAPVFSPLDLEKGAGVETRHERRDSRVVRLPPPAYEMEQREDTRDLAAFLQSTARVSTTESGASAHAPPLDELDFFDPGGLLAHPSTHDRAIAPATSSPTPTTSAHDFASPRRDPSPVSRGSRALLSDLSGLISTPSQLRAQSRSSHDGRRSRPLSGLVETISPSDTTARPRPPEDSMDLQDIGGLLR